MKKTLILIFTLIGFASLINAQTESRLFRFPTINGNRVVFTYAGDLYTVSKAGGVARKLTNDVGYEMFSHFSPDGKNLAFTAQYDGNTEIYMMSAEGGVPKRLTYTATLGRDDISDRMGPNNIVMTWRDNQSVIYRSRKKSFNDFKGQLFVASVNGGLSEELPFPVGGFCSYSPDKKQIAYNRVFREFRTWKYYKGGMADDIWIYDFTTRKTINITNNISQDIQPMWKDDVIYFLSDRDRTMNLFSYNTKTKETKKLTQFADYDIKFPSLGDNCIAFERGGYLYYYDIASAKVEKISITIADDMLSGRNELKDASKNINSSSVSPDGKRVVFGARGDLWSVPAKSGITKNLTQSSGVHDRNAEWSPNGKYIAYISDQTGEDEIYIVAQDGSGKPIQLTQNSDTYKFFLLWSPDSKKIMWNDKKLRLQYIDIDSKKITQVDYCPDWEFSEFTWAPDSKWIAYVRPDRTTESKIYLYDLATQQKNAVTDGWYEASNPSFSSDGKYLLFVSNRDFNPTYSWTEWNHAYTDMSKVYLITLAKATPSPFAPENDVVKETNADDNTAKKDDKKTDKKDEKKAEIPKTVDVKVDLEGINDRTIALPIDAGSYWNVNSVGDNIYYLRRKTGDDGTSLMMFDLKGKKESEIGNDVGYDISADKQKMLISMKGRYAVIDLPKSKIDVKDYLNLSNMKVWVNLKEEWAQIFNEAWRQMRDFFYAPNMHGVDWKAIHDKYAPLLPYVNQRADLTYIIGEMIGELNVGHAYVGGGDKPNPDRIKTGLLGAQLERDASGFYQIIKILK